MSKQANILDEEAIEAVIRLPTSSNYDKEVKDIALTAITLGLRLGEIFKLRVQHVSKIADSTGLRLKMKLVETKTDREVFKECFCTSSTCVKMWCLTHTLLARVEKRSPALLVFPLVEQFDVAKRLVELLRQQYPGRSLNWGLDGVTGHSFRRSVAVSLKRAEASDSDIKNFGNWKSNVFEAYIDPETKRRALTNSEKILKQ
jgi:integrase